MNSGVIDNGTFRDLNSHFNKDEFIYSFFYNFQNLLEKSLGGSTCCKNFSKYAHREDSNSISPLISFNEPLRNGIVYSPIWISLELNEVTSLKLMV